MSFLRSLYYATGHVFNDMCASMWFTYLLVYFHLVLQFDSTKAGAILLIGQVADALSTPFVGYFSDKNDNMWLCNRLGKRKAWHFVGTLCVLVSFPFIFMPCVDCEHTSQNAQLVYFAAIVAIFQFGWAAVQISHLALIPELTSDEHQRTHLTSLRSRFSVLANIFVYVATYKWLREGNSSNQIGPQDAENFQHIVTNVLIFGFTASVLFHIFVKEKQLDVVDIRRPVTQKSVSEFLRDPKLYQVAVVYTCSRLFVNLGQVYIPLYLHETLVRNAQSLALVPLTMYLSSFVATIIVNPLNRQFGRVTSFVVGGAFGIGGCFWIGFGSGIYYNEFEIYLVAILLGFGGSIMLVTTLGITADLIANDTDSGAFVYGAMSFTDKLINGSAVMIIQHIKCASGCPNYYRDVLAYVCGGAVILGLLPLFSLRRLSQRYAAPTIEPVIEDPSINSQMHQALVH